MSDSKFFCGNCFMEFVTEEEAKDHWAHTCKYGGYNAPINDIIFPIKELAKQQAMHAKWQARKQRRAAKVRA